MYFWTVTFVGLQSDWIRSENFTAFLKHLRRRVGKGWGGVRVAELHREHGLHFHLLVTARIPVDLVREIGPKYGIGRIHVCRADLAAAAYLGKYLSKQRVSGKTESGRNMRRWAAFGDVERVRVSDMECQSPMWVYRKANDFPFQGFRNEVILRRAWDHGVAAFRSAYYALKGDLRVGDAVGIVTGKIEARGLGELVVRQEMGPF